MLQSPIFSDKKTFFAAPQNEENEFARGRIRARARAALRVAYSQTTKFPGSLVLDFALETSIINNNAEMAVELRGKSVLS